MNKDKAGTPVKKRRPLVKVAAWLVMAAFTVLLFEICLRLLNPLFPEPQRSIVQEAIRITYSNMRTYHGSSISVPAKTKISGLVVGDSFVFGTYVKANATFANRLGKLTGEKVFNFGVGAQSPIQYNRLLEVGARYEPDEVIYCIFANDFWEYPPYDCNLSTDSSEVRKAMDGPLFVEAVRGDVGFYRARKWFTNLSVSFQLYKLFQQPIQWAEVSKVEWRKGDLYFQFVEKAFWGRLSHDRPEVRAEMEEMAQIVNCAKLFSDGLGAGFTVVLIPSKEMVYSAIVDEETKAKIFDLSHAKSYQMLNERLTGFGISCLDITPSLQEKAMDGKPLYFAIDGHCNELGHEVTAGLIKDFLYKKENARPLFKLKTMKKKLAIVLSHPIQHFCPMYVNWAKSEQWEICVFFGSTNGAKPYYDEQFKRMVSWEGLGLDQFPHRFLNGDQDLPVTTKLDAPTLFEQLDEYAPDAILTYGYWQILQRRARAWARKKGVPVLFFSDAELRHHRSFLKEMVKKVVVTNYLKTADLFLVTGNANEEYYRKYGVPARKFIRSSYPIDANGYEIAFQNRAELRAAARKKYGIADDEIMVSVVGKLVDWKRQSDLSEAVGKISGQKIVAVLIGSGEREKEFRAVADRMPHNRTVFTGFVDAHDLPGLYAATDIYCHTSEIEPHSVAVSEAIFSGCPVVISHTCGSYGIDDDIHIGANGFVYTCGNTDELAAHLRRLATDHALRARMSERSRAIGVRNQMTAHRDTLGTVHTLLFD